MALPSTAAFSPELLVNTWNRIQPVKFNENVQQDSTEFLDNLLTQYRTFLR